MAIHAVSLEERYFRVAEEKARALGKSTEEYLQILIDADSRSFDEILSPVRQGFSNMDDKELDELFDKARKAARRAT